jgi:hypothetical protein
MIFRPGRVYLDSMVTLDETTYALAALKTSHEKRLLVQGDVDGFSGDEEAAVMVCRLTAENAAELRAWLAWLNPVPLGRQTSFGFGDRLGSATPGHISALHRATKNRPIAPIFAQQSVRENSRQLLHVIYGAILEVYGDELETFIGQHEAGYRAGLERHFARHLSPFS